jgi:putative glutamine amidotransferase
MKIALTRTTGSPRYQNYVEWLRTVDPAVECVDLWSLSSADDAVSVLGSCSGLVVTGGPDIDPIRYDKAHERTRCHIDERRDSIEFPVLARALGMNMPVLGVCRGAQVINVHLGGSMIVDIPADVRTTTEHGGRYEGGVQYDAEHDIHVEPGSLLKKITGHLEGIINSAHHQAIDRLAETLTISARSSDGVVEAIERNEPSQGFLVGVQWHPERMDFANPFSLSLAQHFLFEADSYRTLIQQT